jgi:hypothetical protein
MVLLPTLDGALEVDCTGVVWLWQNAGFRSFELEVVHSSNGIECGSVVRTRKESDWNIESEIRFDFEKVLQLVDSETVLSWINKTSTRFKLYEGVRIGEIQASTDGDVSCWAWLSGENNIADDWLTCGRSPDELGEDSYWWNGPPILYQPFREWDLTEFGIQKNEVLPGEKKIRYTSAVSSNVPLKSTIIHS